MNDLREVKGFSLKEIIFIILITAIITSMTTGLIIQNQNKITKNITYQDLNEDNDLKEFLGVYASLIDEYYEEVDKKALLGSAINAMFSYLGEDYSTYMSKEETEALAQRLMGEYKGIGVSINRENVISNVFDKSPASEAGLLVGDEITAVNDKKIPKIVNPDSSSDNQEETISLPGESESPLDYTVDGQKEITAIIKSANVGDKVKITVKRKEEIKTFEVVVKKLFIPAITYKKIENDIGYLKIDTFSETLKQQVRESLTEMEAIGIKSLIIDLRDNAGGYLSAARDVASLFLEKGKVIYSLEEKEKTTSYKDETDEKRDYKIVVLINEGSASASEVLTAALEESYGALTVGVTSYGKGKVQQTYSLEDGSMAKYTTAKWLTPNGNCIDKVGIKPKVYIELDEENIGVDNQLEKAIENAR